MQGISNSLRQRLGSRPEPQVHPDPDTLTAYMEQVLPATERAEIVLHLSECSYCREVVSLSLPQPESEQIVQHVPVRSGFWVPALRWGAALAMVAVAATLVVEKPWKTVPGRTTQLDEPSQISQPATTSQPAPAPAPPSATNATPATTTTASVTNGPLPAREARVPVVTTELRSAAIPERRAAKTPPPPTVLGLVGGGVQDGASASTDQALQVMAMAPVAVSSPQPPTKEAANKDAEHDYVNTNALRNQRANENGNAVSADAASLPAAPSPKFGLSGQNANNRASGVPRLTAENTRDQYSIALAPPNTTPASPPSAGDTSLAKSSFGYKLKSTIGSAVSAVKKASAAQSPHLSNGFASVMAASNLKPADSGGEAKAESAQQFHWRINPNGILMKSTDYTQWHEAYPQSSDLQLKVLLTKGEQVWAGGNNATLIHSWDAGVDWETLRVPDSGDITAITVDDGWQVKTSNGQTFVSQDHGKTWVPLQAEPK